MARFAALSIGSKDAFPGDCWQISVLELDHSEPSFVVVEHVGEGEPLGTGDVLTDKFSQVALTRHKTDDWHRPIRPVGLDELDDLLPFPTYKNGSAA